MHLPLKFHHCLRHNRKIKSPKTEVESKVVQRNMHRNAGSAMLDTSKEPTEEDLELLCKYFADEVNLLEKMMGSLNNSWRRPVMNR